MNIKCPQCGKEYEIDDNKIPIGGAKVKCSQCQTMIDIDYPFAKPDWYITTDNQENIYEATTDEVKEWILENRLLRQHHISKDRINWSKLEDIPEFLAVFEKKEREEAASSTLNEQISQPQQDEEPVIQSYKKIDYSDYDDSVIESNFKQSKNHFLLWFIVIILIGAGIFALIRPKVVKKIFTKINPQNNIKSEDNYNMAMSLLKNYDIKDKEKILSLFDASLKENPNYEPALIGKALYITNAMYLQKLNIDFREKLNKKLEELSKQKNNEIINKILLNNNKKLLKAKDDYKKLNTLLTNDFLGKIKKIESKQKNHDASVVMGLISFLNNNKNALVLYLSNTKKLKDDDSKTAFLKLLYLKLKNDKNYMMILDELTTKYAYYIPLNFLNSFELLNQDKYGEAKFSFKGIKGLSPDNMLATQYIELINELIKNKKLLTVAPEGEEKKEDSEKARKEEKETQKETKKEVKKEIKKEQPQKPAKPKKLSARRATEIGWELIDANRLNAAIKKFKYAISVNPNYAEAYQGLGEVYRIKKDNENAIKYFKIFLAKDPNNSEAGLVRRQIKQLQGK